MSRPTTCQWPDGCDATNDLRHDFLLDTERMIPVSFYLCPEHKAILRDMRLAQQARQAEPIEMEPGQLALMDVES